MAWIVKDNFGRVARREFVTKEEAEAFAVRMTLLADRATTYTVEETN